MSSFDPFEIREMFGALGRDIGQEEFAQVALSGRLAAGEVVPLLGGIFDAAVRTLFCPMVTVTSWRGFEPMVRPMVGEAVLLDGSRIRITLEALPRFGGLGGGYESAMSESENEAAEPTTEVNVETPAKDETTVAAEAPDGDAAAPDDDGEVASE